MFVHGSVTAPGCRFVPAADLAFAPLPPGVAEPPGFYLPESAPVETWLAALDAYKNASLDDHALRPFWDEPPQLQSTQV